MHDAISGSSGLPDSRSQETESSREATSSEPDQHPTPGFLRPSDYPASDTGGDIVRFATRCVKAWEARDAVFGPIFRVHPGWHILLSILSTGMPAGKFKVSSLSSMAQLPHSTSSRWSNILAERDYLVREDDPRDERRTLVSLSPKGLDHLQAYFEQLRQQGLFGDE